MSDIGVACDVNYVKWMWKSNKDPFNFVQEEKWQRYPSSTAAIIESAHSIRATYAQINEQHMIDLDKMMQINIHDTNRQRPIRRFARWSTENDVNEQSQLCPVRLDLPRQRTRKGSTSQDDVHCHGSQFIMAWLLKFTKGTLKVKFTTLFLALIVGIQWEGQLAIDDPKKIEDIIHELELARDEVTNKREHKGIEHLSKCCVRQYTRECFLYRVVNETLRDDNREKLDTIGPFCYLVFNYIGHRTHDDHSLRYRLLQLFQSAETSFLHLYRGDYVIKEIFDQYLQAAGESNKYFRWMSFVSTSRDRMIGEKFAKNVLYVIELSRVTSNDQFSDLEGIAVFVNEKEILLRPGARFRVKEIKLGSTCEPHVVTIEIAPSFMSIVQ